MGIKKNINLKLITFPVTYAVSEPHVGRPPPPVLFPNLNSYILHIKHFFKELNHAIQNMAK